MVLLSPRAPLSTMADHHDDDLAATKTEGFKVGEKKTMQEYQELGEFYFSISSPLSDLLVTYYTTTLEPHWHITPLQLRI